MKRVTSTVSYLVPRWNFCNIDRGIQGKPNSPKCRFCVKTKDGYQCALYNEELSVRGNYVYKVSACCDTTAGTQSTVIQPDPPTGPVIPPQEVMRQAINLYSKTVRDLMNQGYPQAMADAAARDYVLGNNNNQ